MRAKYVWGTYIFIVVQVKHSGPVQHLAELIFVVVHVIRTCCSLKSYLEVQQSF